MSTIPTGAYIQSPLTNYPFDAFVVYPYGHVDGDDDGGGYLYGSSYGHKDRRARATPSMRIWSIHLVTGYFDLSGVSSSYGKLFKYL